MKWPLPTATRLEKYRLSITQLLSTPSSGHRTGSAALTPKSSDTDSASVRHKTSCRRDAGQLTLGLHVIASLACAATMGARAKVGHFSSLCASLGCGPYSWLPNTEYQGTFQKLCDSLTDDNQSATLNCECYASPAFKDLLLYTFVKSSAT